MCDKNINQIFSVDFSTIEDSFNWNNNTSNPIQTISGKLVLKPENALSEFKRALGAIDIANNTVKLSVNLDISKPQTSTDSNFCALFEVYSGLELIGKSTVSIENLEDGKNISYFLDREYQYSGVSDDLYLKITFIEGFGNVLQLKTLNVIDYNYCDDDIRTYFVVDGFIDLARNSVSSGIKLKNWLVDDVETLTSDFFIDNENISNNTANLWKYAHADIDGNNRVSDITGYNTFNPFVTEWGLDFDEVGSFFGGKPTGTTNGKDYGSGILSIGFEKPEILNGNLESKKGAFFIDIDYTKSLKVVFYVLVNNQSGDIFENPTVYKEYTIEWNANTCTKSFSYKNILSGANNIVDSINDGFLYGITGEVSNTQIISCNQSFNYNGESGFFEMEIDFGTDLGTCGIKYDSVGVPDKFTIEWNGNIVTTGFVGDSGYDQDLINSGVPLSDINTTDPANPRGDLTFIKDQPTPTKGKVIVYAPLSGTAWNMSGICPF